MTAADAPTLAPACAVSVVYSPAMLYPYRPRCQCGWRIWGYVSRHAADLVAAEHMAGRI